MEVLYHLILFNFAQFLDFKDYLYSNQFYLYQFIELEPIIKPHTISYILIFPFSDSESLAIMMIFLQTCN